MGLMGLLSDMDFQQRHALFGLLDAFFFLFNRRFQISSKFEFLAALLAGAGADGAAPSTMSPVSLVCLFPQCPECLFSRPHQGLRGHCAPAAARPSPVFCFFERSPIFCFFVRFLRHGACQWRRASLEPRWRLLTPVLGTGAFAVAGVPDPPAGMLPNALGFMQTPKRERGAGVGQHVGGVAALRLHYGSLWLP